MKTIEDISPWKVTERAETKQFNEENHFSLPKMNLPQRRQSQANQNFIDQQFENTTLRSSHHSLQMMKSKSLGDPWIRKMSEYKRVQMNFPHENRQFRPSPPLVAIKKTYKYHELIENSKGLYGRQSTPMIKQRMQMLLKAYEVQQINGSCLKSLTNQNLNKLKHQKLGTKKTNIEFIYKSELKLKRNSDDSPTRKGKAHILDNLLSAWEG